MFQLKPTQNEESLPAPSDDAPPPVDPPTFDAPTVPEPVPSSSSTASVLQDAVLQGSIAHSRRGRQEVRISVDGSPATTPGRGQQRKAPHRRETVDPHTDLATQLMEV